jgi:hypothetical protein
MGELKYIEGRDARGDRIGSAIPLNTASWRVSVDGVFRDYYARNREHAETILTVFGSTVLRPVTAGNGSRP